MVLTTPHPPSSPTAGAERMVGYGGVGKRRTAPRSTPGRALSEKTSVPCIELRWSNSAYTVLTGHRVDTGGEERRPSMSKSVDGQHALEERSSERCASTPSVDLVPSSAAALPSCSVAPSTTPSGDSTGRAEEGETATSRSGRVRGAREDAGVDVARGVHPRTTVRHHQSRPNSPSPPVSQWSLHAWWSR